MRFELALIFGLAASAAYGQTPRQCPALVDQANAGEVTCNGTARQQICRWDYPYRAKAALARFEALQAVVEQCWPGARRLHDDVPVNHPDSYSALRFDVLSGILTVSLKDKAALDATLVFLIFDERH